MAEQLPSISVMLPTRNRADLLARCIEAVLTDDATCEVVVVVDGDDPATDQVLTRLRAGDERVVVTRTPGEPAELGRVQRGRDHGVALASSEIVLAMDDDVIPRPGLVSGHARRHAERADLVVVGYMPVATPRRWPHTYAPVREYAEAYEGMCRAYAADPGSILRQLWGGNVSLPRASWLKAIKRPRVGSYLDDKELGLLLAEEGMEAVFDPDLRGDHFYERSLQGLVARAEMNVMAQAQLRVAHPRVSVEVVDGRGQPVAVEREARDGQRAGVKAALLRVAKSSPGWLLVKWSMIAAISTAAALRLSTIESKGTVVLSWLAWSRAEAELSPALAKALE